MREMHLDKEVGLILYDETLMQGQQVSQADEGGVVPRLRQVIREHEGISLQEVSLIEKGSLTAKVKFNSEFN